MRILNIVILVSLHTFVPYASQSLAAAPSHGLVDKVHLPEDITSYFGDKVADRNPEFAEVVTKHLNETQDLLKNIKNQINTGSKTKNRQMSSTYSDLIESKIYQLENMRDGVLQQLSELGVGKENSDIKPVVDIQSIISRKTDARSEQKRSRLREKYKAKESAPIAFRRKINKLIKLLTALKYSKEQKKIESRLNKAQSYVKQLTKAKTGRKMTWFNRLIQPS